MLRPSRPMMRPFMSSLASSTTVTVVSAVWLAATRCSASATRARARRRASRSRLLLHLPDRARELVAHEILRPLEQRRLRLAERHARDALELLERLARALAFMLLLELLEVHLAVADALLAARHLDELLLDLRLPLRDPLLDLRDLDPAGPGPRPRPPRGA